MDDFDKEIKKIITKEVKLSEDYKSSVRNTINNCIQNSKKNLNTNKHTVEHNFYSYIDWCKYNYSICCNNKKF